MFKRYPLGSYEALNFYYILYDIVIAGWIGSRKHRWCVGLNEPASECMACPTDRAREKKERTLSDDDTYCTGNEEGNEWSHIVPSLRW